MKSGTTLGLILGDQLNTQHSWFRQVREDVLYTLMESFYRQMRRHQDILIDNGRPVGGKWNDDQSNRQRYDGKVSLPEICAFNPDIPFQLQMVNHTHIDRIYLPSNDQAFHIAAL